MEFRVLGPLEVRIGGIPVQLGGPKQRAVLAALLLHANRVVPVDRLVDMAWGESPPATVAVQVQGQVSALRRLFAEAGTPDALIVTHPSGYLIRVEPGQLDLDVFDRWAGEAREALSAGRVEEAAAGFAAALDVWHGAALGDVAGMAMQAEAARLEERRLAVLEERIEADLDLGRHADLVPELTALTSEHPLRERLRGHLMMALHRCGRQADALAVYRETRAVLVEELGLEPGVELQRLEQSILAGEAWSRAAVPVTAPPAMPPPAQLPADVADFTGRTKPVASVRDQLALAGDGGGRSQAVAVSAVAGKAGVGKTTLAVHVAHRLSGSFPDGQLYLNLRGAGTDPVDPSQALDRFLHALGVDGAAIPDGLDERAAMYRSRLAGRRVLVLLDNAADEAQVRPLLPGSASCAVLITSRTRLAGLEGANLLDLDVLATEEAIELLARIAGWQRVSADPSTAQQIVRLCGDLPLAVRIAGARLVTRPHWPLNRLGALLTDERRRLDELQIGDLEVRASLALSYAGLDQAARCAFRRLGLLGAPDFAGWVVAALLDVPLPRAEQVVERLVDAQLLEVADPGPGGQPRYRLHDLLRIYARERVQAEDTLAEREAALTRALGGWLDLAGRASQSMQGTVSWIQHSNAPRWQLEPDAASTALLADPSAWFEGERPALIAAVEQAGAAGLSDVAWDLANSLAFHLGLRGRFADWRHTHDVALAATRRAGDHRGTAVMLRGLSEVHTYQDRYEEALQCLEQALACFRQANDRDGAADVHCGFGVVHRIQGRSQDALRSFQRALALLSEVGDRPDRAYVLLGLGMSLLDQSRPDEAESHIEQALASFRAVGYGRGEAQALHRLGNLYHAQGRLPEAVTCLRRALSIFDELGERHSNAYALLALGQTHADQHLCPQAEELLERCLGTFRELGDRGGEGRTLQALGVLHHRDDHPDRAVACLTGALRIWRDLRLTSPQARTLESLGAAYAATGHRDAARASWLEALRLFRELGAAEADELAGRLDQDMASSEAATS